MRITNDVSVLSVEEFAALHGEDVNKPYRLLSAEAVQRTLDACSAKVAAAHEHIESLGAGAFIEALRELGYNIAEENEDDQWT